MSAECGLACCKWLFSRENKVNEEIYYLTIVPPPGDETFEKFQLSVTREEKELLEKSEFSDLIQGKTIEQTRDLFYNIIGRQTYCKQ